MIVNGYAEVSGNCATHLRFMKKSVLKCNREKKIHITGTCLKLATTVPHTSGNGYWLIIGYY